MPVEAIQCLRVQFPAAYGEEKSDGPINYPAACGGVVYCLAGGCDFCYGSRVESLDIDIEALIPHRGRMRLIDAVIAVDAERAVSSATVTKDWPLVREGSVDILVAIELVAQTAALLEGWKRLQSRRGGVTGWLVGIKSAAFRRPRVAVPATLITTASRSYALEGYAVFSGTVSSGAEVLADVQIQAFRPEDAG